MYRGEALVFVVAYVWVCTVAQELIDFSEIIPGEKVERKIAIG